MTKTKEIMKNIWTDVGVPLFKQNPVNQILAKQPSQITEAELSQLREASFSEFDTHKKKKIADTVQKTFEYMYPNPRQDATGRAVSDKVELPDKPIQTEQEKVEDIALFLKKHVEKVGEEQAFEDFQKGLNLLNKYNRKSPNPAKRPLLQDGDFGAKTTETFKQILNYYPPRVIKKYIKIGAINNAIIKDQDNGKVNAAQKVEEINADLKPKEEVK